jgi:hypothetical protein
MADSVEQVNLVQEDRWNTVTDIANKLDIRHGSAYSVIHKDLGYHKICAMWMPNQLTYEHKWADVEICMQVLQKHHEGEAFMQWSVTGSETWRNHHEPTSKCQCME